MQSTQIRLGTLAMTLCLGAATVAAAEGLASYYPAPEGIWLQTGKDRFLAIERQGGAGSPQRGLVLLVPGVGDDPGGLDRDLGLPLSQRGWHSLTISLPQGPTPRLAASAAERRIRFAMDVLGKDGGQGLFILTSDQGLKQVIAATTPPLAQPLRGLIWLDPAPTLDPTPLVEDHLPILAISSGKTGRKRKGIRWLSLPLGTTKRWRAARIAAWMQRLAGQALPADTTRTGVGDTPADR